VGTGWTPDSKVLQSAVAAIVPKSGDDEPEVIVTVTRPECASGSITRSYRSKLHPYEGINISELSQSEKEAYR